jgi:hypothetical protein
LTGKTPTVRFPPIGGPRGRRAHSHGDDGRDENGDGLLDQVCHFAIQRMGFRLGDTVGILKGRTVDGTLIEGRDAVLIVP